MTQCHFSESCELVAAYSDEDVISQAQTIVSQSNWMTVLICHNVIFWQNKYKIKSWDFHIWVAVHDERWDCSLSNWIDMCKYSQ